MAQKRMFNLKIIDSAKFLKMPLSSQLLYFHLCMRADDDGVVEGYNVIRMTGINEDDLRVLASKGFIKVLNEDLVAYVMDWREHNSIRADRKIDSIYKDLLLQVVPEVNLLQKKQRADIKKSGQSMDSPDVSTRLIHDGIEQNSTEQNSIEQNSIEQQQNSIEKVISEQLNCSIEIANKIYNITKQFHPNSDVAVVVREKLKIIKNGNFNNQIGALIAAIKDNWEKPIQNKTNTKDLRFNNFAPREYDYDNLERKLLGWEDEDD